MKIGDTVYWLGTGNSVICSGRLAMISGTGRSLVIEYGEGLIMWDMNQTWNKVFVSVNEACREGITSLTKTITEANRAMVSLMDQMQKHQEESQSAEMKA